MKGIPPRARQHLQGHGALHGPMHGLVDLPHPALPDTVEDQIVAEDELRLALIDRLSLELGELFLPDQLSGKCRPVLLQ